MEKNVFDFLDENTERECDNEENTSEYQIEAYQIVKIVKTTVGLGAHRREVIDTIYVNRGNPELAKSRAVNKAQLLGTCLVLEKCERIVESNVKKT